jgi:hypothetical protein
MKKNNLLPDFIIAGAMKCGTSSLHHILAHHPDIFIPDKELHFYDMDDMLQHPDFFIYEGKKWQFPDFQEEKEAYLNWYNGFFRQAKDGSIKGEDSTTYIASTIAPKRIADINPSAKIIILLRDPADRCYSHYWHLVRTGRTSERFERALYRNENMILQRSLYRRQLEHWLDYITAEKMMFIPFEKFINSMDEVIRKVLQFIGADLQKLLLESVETHRNKALYPRSLALQLVSNKLSGSTRAAYYRRHLPYIKSDKKIRSFYSKALNRIHQFNLTENKKKPAMNRETRKVLDQYFRNCNEGLNELTGQEMDTHWYKTLPG